MVRRRRDGRAVARARVMPRPRPPDAGGIMSAYEQEGFAVRFEWGPEGARELGRSSRVVIVVDVLSFSSAVDVAVARGAGVFVDLRAR